MMNAAMFCMFHFVTFRVTNHVDANTRPKKKDHTSVGWLVSSWVIIFAREKTLMAIPMSSAVRKLPFIVFQNVLNCPFMNSFNVCSPMLFMDVISFS